MKLYLFLTLLTFSICQTQATRLVIESAPTANASFHQPAPRTLTNDKVIHVLVALCDNEHQGIVPVPARIGNGEDAANNLYWGAGFGVKTFFSKSKEWKLIGTSPVPHAAILERLVFKHRTQSAWLVADAYRGSEMQRTIQDLMAYASGQQDGLVGIADGSSKATLAIGSRASLLAFVGHNGLMDFSLNQMPVRKDQLTREVIVLCCISRRYFAAPLKAAGAYPLLVTTGLMAPEAYVWHAAVTGWLKAETGAQIKERAAMAYNTYQHCGLRGARNLFRNWMAIILGFI